MGTTIDNCRTCKHAFTTGKDRWYCKKSLADKDDCGEYETTGTSKPDVLDKAIEALSELRAKYNCFDEKEEPFYNALSLGIKSIKALDQEDILEKIRSEIERTATEEQKHDEKWAIGLRYAVKIIDKYKAEVSGE